MLIFKFIKRLFKQSKVEIDPKMKFLVVGLGNMHPDYDGTRHNVGFEVLDLLASEKEAVFKNDTLGDLCLIKHRGRQINLLKPSTYMNLSGKAVRYWMQKLKIDPDKVLIIVDDINLEFGKIRMRKSGAHGGHNGLKDVERMLGTNKYSRLRIGIGSDFSKGKQVDYVLGHWSEEEIKGLKTILPKSADATLSFCSIGINHTMNRFNN